MIFLLLLLQSFPGNNKRKCQKQAHCYRGLCAIITQGHLVTDHTGPFWTILAKESHFENETRFRNMMICKAFLNVFCQSRPVCSVKILTQIWMSKAAAGPSLSSSLVTICNLLATGKLLPCLVLPVDFCLRLSCKKANSRLKKIQTKH